MAPGSTSGGWSLTPTTNAAGRISLSYLHPKLADIAPATTIDLLLRAEYGFSGSAEHADSYPLVLDATPPTLSIVSPADGDRIVLG